MEASISSMSNGEFLNQKSTEIKSWYDSGPQTIDGLEVRKMPARIEPTEFIKTGKSAKDFARFQLIVSKNHKQWSIDLEMRFHYKPWLANDGTAQPAGLMFVVLDEDTKAHPVEFFPTPFSPEQNEMNAPQFFLFWLQKLLKRPTIKIIFAHRQMLISEMDD